MDDDDNNSNNDDDGDDSSSPLKLEFKSGIFYCISASGFLVFYQFGMHQINAKFLKCKLFDRPTTQNLRITL